MLSFNSNFMKMVIGDTIIVFVNKRDRIPWPYYVSIILFRFKTSKKTASLLVRATCLMDCLLFIFVRLFLRSPSFKRK